MRRLVTFASERARHVRMPIIRDYPAEAARLVESGRRFGLEGAIHESPLREDGEFYRENRGILDLPHFGWLFQPWAIWCEMERAAEGIVSCGLIVISYCIRIRNGCLTWRRRMAGCFVTGTSGTGILTRIGRSGTRSF